jgi:hypothetical protein
LKESVDPKLYGLPSRTVLIKTRGSEEFILVINRKSRIIMKDAKTILNKADKIKEKIPSASVSLETTAPVCSKSIKFLKENDVETLKKDK